VHAARPPAAWRWQGRAPRSLQSTATQEPFSRGFSCPKAYGVQELYDDPDRLRPPVRRTEPS
jgi:anaerobic selenocysteine-containing dehydrogenase